MRILYTEETSQQDAQERVRELTALRGPLSYYLRTFGCQMNEHDSELLRGMLRAMGFTPAQEPEQADLILFNSCAVRENAQQRVFGNIGRLKSLRAANKNLIIGLCGCMAEQPEVQKTLREHYPYVRLAFGPHHLYRLPSLLFSLLSGEEKTLFLQESGEYSVVESIPHHREPGVKAFVNIMEGCDNFCSYCIVPYTRGRERSRLSEDILDEIRHLVDEGFKEVMLLGQNVNSYGKGLEETIDFATLLERISEIKGLRRIRFMTSHPKDLSDRLIEVMAQKENVMPSLHLPVQSGSDRLLKKMNRKYTREDYLQLVRKLREAIPHISLSTDIIMGFPTEEEQDVLDTIDLLRQVDYDSAFTFLYSPREGTPAAKWIDATPEKVKQERFERMLNVLNEGVIHKNAEKEGKVLEVLTESIEEDGRYLGRSRENDLVRFTSQSSVVGEIVLVRITRAKKFSLEGEKLESSTA